MAEGGDAHHPCSGALQVPPHAGTPHGSLPPSDWSFQQSPRYSLVNTLKQLKAAAFKIKYRNLHGFKKCNPYALNSNKYFRLIKKKHEDYLQNLNIFRFSRFHFNKYLLTLDLFQGKMILSN